VSATVLGNDVQEREIGGAGLGEEAQGRGLPHRGAEQRDVPGVRERDPQSRLQNRLPHRGQGRRRKVDSNNLVLVEVSKEGIGDGGYRDTVQVL
jgi:hypothetical protein